MALAQARRALSAGEAPIGCVVACATGEILGVGYNTLRESGNPILHAELNAITAASPLLAAARDVTMVSTLEPCVMCTGAAMQVGVTAIVYGLRAPADAGTSRVRPPTAPGTTDPIVIGDICAAESRALFVDWLARHERDQSRAEQRAFIEQLLTLTAVPSQ